MNSEQQSTPGDFPKTLPWPARAGGAPHVPGGPTEIIGNLKALLENVAGNSGYDRSFTWPGADTPTELRKVLHLMGTCGLLVREGRPTRLRLTEAARHFLATSDELYLIGVLHANVRFIGEALAAVGEGATHVELNRVAVEQYGLGWGSLDQVRRRVYWLRAAGLVEFWSNGRIVLTERGRQFLPLLEPAKPEDLPHRRRIRVTDLELPEPPALLAAGLESLDQTALRERKIPTGYVAGGWRVEGISRLMNAAVPEIDREGFTDFCVEEFGVAESSAEQTLQTLRALGFLTQVGSDAFAVSDLGASCLASGEALDFIRLLHMKVALVGETLDTITDEVKSAGLVDLLACRYPGAQLTREETTRRVALLLETGLAERIGLVIRRTELGTALVRTLPLLNPSDDIDPAGEAVGDHPGPPQAAESVANVPNWRELLAAEIVRAATDSADYQRFERAVAGAFRALGLEAEAHGGSKKTDVVIDLWRSPTDRLRVAVEAKTDGEGLVTDQDVKFLRLGEHRARHGAQRTLLVGPRFDARVQREAAEGGVALLTAEQLADAVLRHGRTPLAPHEISGLVTVTDASGLEPAWQAAERRQDVLSQVLLALWRSGNDPADIEHNAGALGVRDIWRETKGALDTPLERQEIEEALEFMASPFVAAVAQHHGDHVITAPPALVAARLRALAAVIDAAGGPGTAAEGTVTDPPEPSPQPDPGPAPRERRAAAVAVAEGVDPRLVRKWAKNQGRVISERGRLSSGLIKDYWRAHEPRGE
ncbi:restriction endonuclease [Kitasatospora cineracea]|uniref:restriction endonuclease n=1 Tax=Kitasatospora cineracea TaxID=88074 RepID=UPI00380D48DB